MSTLRLWAARLLMVASIALLSACESVGNVNWTVTQTTDTPSASASPTECPYGPLVDGPGCAPSPAPSSTPPAGVDYLPLCLPSDPPGTQCVPPGQ
jgi:hypothetical protein